METTPPPSQWSKLSSDMTELILSYLPLKSLVRASTVCKHWNSITVTTSFKRLASTTKPPKPWFFLYGQNNVFFHKNQAFGFDPEAQEWVPLPSSHDCFSGAGGFFFSTTTSSTNFSYSPLLKGPWKQTSPLWFARSNPLIGVFDQTKFIVVGGARFIGGLVDIEDRLAVEIYDTATDSWELCPPLPSEFRSGNSSQWLSSALVDSKFFVFGIYSCFMSSFDLNRKIWCRVDVLKPPGALFCYLVACKDRLMLAGLCSRIDLSPCFVIWNVNWVSMDYEEIAVMPKELLGCLFDSDEDDARFASLKCVGIDGVMYVFNEDHHKDYPACVCEIGDGCMPVCRWWKVPPLPGPVNRFHKVIAFSSCVPLHSVLGGNGAQ